MWDRVFTMNIHEFIQTFPAFRSSSDTMLNDLLTAGRLQPVAAGTQIYHEGDACSAIAFVLAGEIRVYKIGQTGREITLYEIGPGETCILNASCILAGQNYPAHAVAAADTDLLLVPSAEFRKLVSDHETMREFVFTLLSRRLSGVMELVEEVAFGRMDERLEDYLVERSADNRLATTHQKIANDLGTSREVVSRLLKDLERKGRVRLSRNEITLLSGGWR
jgi:CRP/FNR family transcriptional regulator, anaerobic regulatory protein